MRKKVDDRVRSLIEKGVKVGHRSMFVIIGDKSRDQIVNLHFMLGKAVVKARPSVLWCYKEKLELSSHRKKRVKQVKKMMQRGLLDPEKADPFSLFIESGVVSYCLYRDSERILGNTFGMCILQDVHQRFRTESHSEIVSRFNERFLLSLASCKACLVMDDELNILPISSHVMSAIEPFKDYNKILEAQEELKILKEQLHDVLPVGPLVSACTTLDQGKSLSTLLDAILEKNYQATIALIASRGRGKSAALGLAIAGAVAAGYSRIFVTAPSAENLRSLFDFVLRGLRVLNIEEHTQFDVVRSTDPVLRKAITQINIFKEHRQIIQYIEPQDHAKLSQAELLIIDEAAAIPLPVIKSLLGPYLVFLSSTVNGYEGTGRSLSLKLLSHLEKQSYNPVSGRVYKKLELRESIRYSSGDPIEAWLNDLLCLDATNSVPHISRFPHPKDCNLYYVNRDTLFSFHKESEIFLKRLVALYVSSHYKNSPNDLQLMADAPAHHIFVLLGPVDEGKNVLPDILCFIQVCLEGQIAQNSAMQCLRMGHFPPGDQIPWKFCEEFENTDFPYLSGVRIVRIAVHPSAQGQGYGSAALDLVTRYYESKLTDMGELSFEENSIDVCGSVIEAAKKISLLEETIRPRQNLPPLLVHPRERLPERVDYIGASFGINKDLFRFWKKHKFTPFYICDTPNNATGECSCMVLKPLETGGIENNGLGSLGFLAPFHQRFKTKFVKRLPLCFGGLDYKLAMSILDPKISFEENDPSVISQKESSLLLKFICSPGELKLLEAYKNNCKDYGKVKHLLPLFAHHYFMEKLPVTLSHVEASLLLSMGLQLHDITYIQVELKPHAVSVDEDLNDGACKAMVSSLGRAGNDELELSLQRCSRLPSSGVLSVPSKRRKHDHKMK
ncbi:hypothetical protein BVRB_8g181730 isoform B [Beta vulgaris subsp. vulgaris]|nr:hypothetical protein BVRB_8g181730 isoform B [Beta vulgaris subsp. vulgaris]